MASFSVRFLGCKVSYADAQAVRERLLGDGHTEVASGGDVAVVNTCCVTHEAISKSRQAASRAARSHAQVYVTGCGANLRGAFAAMPDNVDDRGRQERGAARDRGRPRRRHRVRPVGRPRGANARVREDPGRMLVLVCLLRHSARSRRDAQPPAPPRCSRRSSAESRRDIARSSSRASTSGCFRDREAGFTLPRLIREAGALPGVRTSSPVVDRGEPPERRPGRGAPRDRAGLAATCTSRCSRETTPSCARWDGATRRRSTSRSSSRSSTSTSPPTSSSASRARTTPPSSGRSRSSSVPDSAVSTSSRTHRVPARSRPGDDSVPRAVKKERGARLRALSEELSRSRWQTRVGTTDRVLVDRPGRGYGDDYTPWLLDGDVGQLLHARAVGVSEEGILAVAA